jgi:hypothetical protein
MRRKIVLAALLCLATAALGIGAASALAADGCSCHTAVPPTGGAPAAHAPLVVGVTHCTTCHKGMTVPHPEVVKPTLTLEVHYWGFTRHWSVSGGLHIPWVPLRFVTVYFQGKAPDATAFTDLAHFRTLNSGSFRRYLDKRVIWKRSTVRAISQGRAGPPVVMPAFDGPAVDLPTPTLRWRLRGPVDGTLRLGRSVTAKAWVTPKDLVGARHWFEVHKRVAGDWKWLRSVASRRPLSATGTYGWTWTPKHRGMYKMFTWVDGTSAYERVGYSHRLIRVR